MTQPGIERDARASHPRIILEKKMKVICAITIMTSIILIAQSYSFAADPVDCPDYKGGFFKEINPEINRSWNNFYKIYKQTPSECDDGAYAEGYSNFVVWSLAKYWDRFDELVSLIKKDPSFRVFVLKHIDATTDLFDLKTLSKNARKQCPSPAASLCKEIDRKAQAAIEEIRAY